MLVGLVPKDVVRRRKDEIYEVMGELAGIVEEEDVSSWPHSRKKCVEWACLHFGGVNLEDPKLRTKLRRLGDTWHSEYCY